MSPKEVPTASQRPSGLASMALARLGFGKSIRVTVPDAGVSCRGWRRGAARSGGGGGSAPAAVRPRPGATGRRRPGWTRNCRQRRGLLPRRSGRRRTRASAAECRRRPRPNPGRSLRCGLRGLLGRRPALRSVLPRSRPAAAPRWLSGTGPRRRRGPLHRRSGPRRTAGAAAPGRPGWLRGRGRGRPCAAASGPFRGIRRRWTPPVRSGTTSPRCREGFSGAGRRACEAEPSEMSSLTASASRLGSSQSSPADSKITRSPSVAAWRT